jgi:hypothetical protein
MGAFAPISGAPIAADRATVTARVVAPHRAHPRLHAEAPDRIPWLRAKLFSHTPIIVPAPAATGASFSRRPRLDQERPDQTPWHVRSAHAMRGASHRRRVVQVWVST